MMKLRSKRSTKRSLQEAVNQSKKAVNSFDKFDDALLKDILITYFGPRALLLLSMTSKRFFNLINISGTSLENHNCFSVVDHLLFAVSPRLVDYPRPKQFADMPFYLHKLHTWTYFQEVTRAKKEFLVSCGDEHTILAVNNHEVDESSEKPASGLGRDTILTFGDGSLGRLGHGDEEGSIDPKKVIIPDEDLQSGRAFVKSVIGGYNHSLVLLTNGHLYGFGSNDKRQLAPYFDTARPVLSPARIRLPARVKVAMISCARNYSAIVLDDEIGTILLLGTGLGAETKKYGRSRFKMMLRGEISSKERVTDVSAGDYHMLILTNRGNVYSIGINTRGQLGIGRRTFVPSGQFVEQEIPFFPTPMALNFDYNQYGMVAQVAAGKSHSLLITRNGRLFSWGAGGAGQLGNGSYAPRNYLPAEVRLPGNAFPVLMSCGNDHSVILDIDGRVMTCGKNDLGQTSFNSSFFVVDKPAFVNSGEFTDFDSTYRKLFDVSAGNTHSAVLGTGRKLFMFGETDKCGGGGVIRKNVYRLRPSIVPLGGGMTTDNYADLKKHYTANYWRQYL